MKRFLLSRLNGRASAVNSSQFICWEFITLPVRPIFFYFFFFFFVLMVVIDVSREKSVSGILSAAEVPGVATTFSSLLFR